MSALVRCLRLSLSCGVALTLSCGGDDSAGTGATAGSGGSAGSATGGAGLGGAAGTSGTSGSSGTGGVAGCTQGATQPCYSGPVGTADVGTCKRGVATCVGGEFSACVGEVLPGADLCTTAADEDCDGQTAACSGKPLWGLNIGGYLYEYVYSGAWTADGALYAAGSTNAHDADFGDHKPIDSKSAGQAFVARYSSAGQLEWVDTLGVFADPGLLTLAKVSDVAADSAGRAVIVGSMSGPGKLGPLGDVGAGLFVARIGADGTLGWIKHFPGTETDAQLAVIDNDAIVLHGSYKSAGPDFGDGALANLGSESLFYAVFTAEGVHLASRAFSSTIGNGALDVQRLPGGGFVLAGKRDGAIDLGNGTGPDPNLNPDTDYNRLYVVQFNAAGAVTKHWSYPAVPFQDAYVAGSPEGDVILAGTSGYSNAPYFGGEGVGGSAFVVRLGADGLQKASWSMAAASISAASVAADGSVVLAGSYDGLDKLPGEEVEPPNKKDRAYVIKLDPTLKLLWTQIGYADPVISGPVGSYFVATAPTGRAAIGGMFFPSLTFGKVALKSPSGAQQGWVVALDP